MNLEESHGGFTTTEWTLVEALHSDDAAVRSQALETLAGRYWPPIYAWVRRSGRNRDESVELTQAFFADVVMGRRLLDRADSLQGKLRTLILTALKRYLVDSHRRWVARPANYSVPLDHAEREEAILLSKADCPPDTVFERRWALAVFEEALERCRRRFRANDRERHWKAFESRVIQPAVHNCQPPPLAALAGELGFQSPALVASAVQLVKKRFLIILRQTAAETVAEEHQEAEYQTVLAVLSEG